MLNEFVLSKGLFQGGGLYQEYPTFDESDSSWWIDEHCVVMYACDDALVYVSAPLQGLVADERDSFKDICEECGSYALYVR